jgi:tetratricopeptide (TPR) repeat protein/opacity protein-like surface antigen
MVAIESQQYSRLDLIWDGCSESRIKTTSTRLGFLKLPGTTQSKRLRRDCRIGQSLRSRRAAWVHLSTLLSCVLAAAVSSSAAFAQPCADAWQLISAEGTVEVRRAGQSNWAPTERGDFYCLGDSIRAEAYSRAALLLPNETVFRLDQNTTITFITPRDQKRTWVDVIEGALHIISRDPTALGVLTPFANAGIEGTEFLVVVTEQETTVTVFEGEVAVSNAAGETSAGNGQRVSVRSGQSPLAQAVVRPRDAVQWTLYYVPIINQELPQADQAPSSRQERDPSFYTGRAARKLGVGRVDEARSDLEVALSLDSTNVEALSLQSIVALTRNDKDEALRLANQAIGQNPRSGSALVALSYAQQAFFDISGALATLQSAVEHEPENALAWARLSELWLAAGDLDQGLSAAQMAASLNPDIERTQTVLGFAYLTRVETQRSIEAFQRAIALDQSAPLPRLGLGLALIRDGELASGRGQIETAVILDPGNALVRSYMGKAYYDEKRDELAESQLAIAKELDPLDPTAWFYDAIRKQTTNRPVEALRDLQRSIELNGNRAVYRSQLLVDEDLASRSAGLARIYRDLGFESLALIEGWSSVEANPGDYSGHRFLADVYSTLPLHQIARVNELFKSQLLQPLNMTPIQPQLGEVNTFLLDAAGPAEIAFNEFNPLFNRNRWAIQGSGVTGSNETRGEDIVVSGLHDKLSFSLGQFHFETDGFRENNDIDHDIVNAFVQFQASHNTSLQAEFRSSDVEKGDLRLLFDRANYSTLRQSEAVDSVRLGARHRMSARSELLGSLIYQDAIQGVAVPGLFTSDAEVDGYGVDLQHLLRVGNWQLASGISSLEWELEETIPFLPVLSSTLEHSTAYVYASVGVAGDAKILLGGSFDSIATVTVNDDRFNPKFGLFWNIRPKTILRLAAFRTTQGPFISRQNIQPRLEPTQVAGFNQLFYGSTGEEAWRYGVALDRSFSPELYVGVEISRRDIDFPWEDFRDFPPIPVVVDVAEDLARAYVNWIPHDRLGVSAEYQYEKTDNSGWFLPEGFSLSRTERLPLQLTYHNPWGLNAGLTATYVDQEGDFEDLSLPPFSLPITQGDSFWVLDASMSYRLKNRLGIVSVVVNNLLDEEFRFQDSDPENSRILPERMIFLKFTLAY